MSSDTCSRSESFESIPEVEFLKQIISEQVDDINKSLMTEFKKLEIAGKLLPEPLLIPDKSRFVLFPIKHHDVSIVCCLMVNSYLEV